MLIKLKLSVLVAAVLSLVGSFVLGHGTRAGAQPATPNANEIVIQNFAFEPATLTVKVGTKVTWVNRDDDPHTATATDKRFNSKTLDTGEQFSMEFKEPGTYKYYCALHPRMTGEVIVK
jgi:plastocyanin